jgi:NNP family nitrate/nitrite transporter-like MFS transporter
MWEEGHWQGPDYDDNGKKKSIQLWRFDRPHMRAFHFAWFAFLMCFIMWFVVPPLMLTIRKPKCAEPTSDICLACNAQFADQKAMAFDKVCKLCAPYDERNNAGCGGLGLTKDQVIVSNAVSVLGTILVRILIGAVADAIGVRYSYIILLVFSAIPGFCVAAVDSPDSLIAVRFLISSVGGSFVLTQLWTSIMFSANIVGTANATTAGWGNLGGAVAGAVIPRVFNSLKASGYDNDKAWRYASVWPPAVMMFLAILIFFFTDDTPVGRYSELRAKKKEREADPNWVDDGKETGGEEPAAIAGRSLKVAAANWRTWILFLAYAFCFGVELVVYNNLPSYFADAFKQNQTEAAQTMTYFGLFNIFARSLGGITSDLANKYFGVRGRLWNQFWCAFLMGVFLLVFSDMTLDKNGYGGAIGALCAWALFLCMTEGAVFGLVPFIEPTAVGGVSGIVGAGGNAGALGLNFLMAIGKRPALNAVGWLSLWSAILIPLIWIPGSGSMFRKDTKGAQPIFEEELVAEDKAEEKTKELQAPQYPAPYGMMPYGYPGAMMPPFVGSPPPGMMPPPMQMMSMPYTGPMSAGQPAFVTPMGY